MDKVWQYVVILIAILTGLSSYMNIAKITSDIRADPVTVRRFRAAVFRSVFILGLAVVIWFFSASLFGYFFCYAQNHGACSNPEINGYLADTTNFILVQLTAAISGIVFSVLLVVTIF